MAALRHKRATTLIRLLSFPLPQPPTVPATCESLVRHTVAAVSGGADLAARAHRQAVAEVGVDALPKDWLLEEQRPQPRACTKTGRNASENADVVSKKSSSNMPTRMTTRATTRAPAEGLPTLHLLLRILTRLTLKTLEATIPRILASLLHLALDNMLLIPTMGSKAILHHHRHLLLVAQQWDRLLAHLGIRTHTWHQEPTPMLLNAAQTIL